MATPSGTQPSPDVRPVLNRDPTGSSYIIVVMTPEFQSPFAFRVLTIGSPQGVSGTGKSTLGTALARTLDVPFVDGDDLHPAANVAKMSRGEPLDDVDRQPWLEIIRQAAVERARGGVIVACSSLKKAYRAVLRGEGAVPTYFVYLKADEGVVMTRMAARQGHFMKAEMLASQIHTLESPEGEPGVVTVSVETSTEAQLRAVVETLGL